MLGNGIFNKILHRSIRNSNTRVISENPIQCIWNKVIYFRSLETLPVDRRVKHMSFPFLKEFPFRLWKTFPKKETREINVQNKIRANNHSARVRKRIKNAQWPQSSSHDHVTLRLIFFDEICSSHPPSGRQFPIFFRLYEILVRNCACVFLSVWGHLNDDVHEIR